MSHAFVSYAREDQDKVDRLCEGLRARGVKPWLDRERIQPGEPWQVAIREAIVRGAFFIACFSKQYLARSEDSFLKEELALGAEQVRSISSVRARFIPVRLDECEIPNEYAGGDIRLHSLQWVDLFADWNEGVRQMAEIINPLISTFDISKSWAHREGQRNLGMVRFDLSSAFGSTRIHEPPEEFQNSVWAQSAIWKVRVKPVEGANLDQKRVGVIRSQHSYDFGEDGRGETVLADYHSAGRNGFEKWQAYEEWESSGSASGILISSFAVLAWYQDGLGHTYYDDNSGSGYVVRWEPNLAAR